MAVKSVRRREAGKRAREEYPDADVETESEKEDEEEEEEHEELSEEEGGEDDETDKATPSPKTPVDDKVKASEELTLYIYITDTFAFYHVILMLDNYMSNTLVNP